jgi:hypothetical protein
MSKLDMKSVAELLLLAGVAAAVSHRRQQQQEAHQQQQKRFGSSLIPRLKPWLITT